jgi:Ca2+-binding RTX toxin-like protein
MASARDSVPAIAQAAPLAPAALPDRLAAGRIEMVVGAVFIVKLDGSRVPAQVGATVFEGDIVVTQAGGGATIDFGRAIATLGSDARMLVETGGAQPVFFVLQGQFGMQAFGVVPNTPDQITVRTPVGTAVLRQGRMLGRAAAEAVSNSFVLLPNGNGSTGALTITTAAGTVLLDRAMQATTVVSLFRSPMPAVERDLASLQGEFGSGILAGWLPAAPVAAPRPLPQVWSTLLGEAGEALAARGSRLIDFIFPPAAAAVAFEFTPGLHQDNTFLAATLGAISPAAGTPANPLPLPPAPVSLGSVGALIPAGSVSFQGTSGFDLFSLTADPIQPNNISIGANALGQVVITDAAGNAVLLTGVEELDLTLGAASDSVILGDLTGTDIADSTVFIHGGAGDDTIDGSAAGKRLVLFGDEGNDLLIGGIKDDDLFGGTGNDTLIGNGGNDLLDGGAGNDLLDGGSGTDTASFAGAPGPVTASLASGAATGNGTDTLTGVENLIGSDFGDLLQGDGSANRLEGGEGNDTLIGGAGNDTLVGGGGRDTASFAAAPAGVNVSLANGNAAGDGSDTLVGVEDLIGSGFADTLTGDAGDNAINAGIGNDSISWSSGAGSDTVVGGAGSDTLDAAVSGSATLAAVSGAAVVTGSGSVSMTEVEVLRITGSSGTDTIVFGSLAGTGVTSLIADAGGGVDTASFATATAAVDVDLAATSATGFTNFAGFESIIGSGFADTLRGSNNGDTLDGGGGNDSIDGRAGNDSLIGGAGNDTLDGQGGNDTLIGGLGNDTVNGQGNDDLIIWSVGDGNDTIAAAGGTDTLDVTFGTATATLSGSPGQTLNVSVVSGVTEAFTATNIDDVRLFATNGSDNVVVGSNVVINSLAGSGLGNGDLQLHGLDGNDLIDARGATVDLLLFGGAGNDTLMSDSPDTLIGGLGSDTLQGSAGVAQQFRYTATNEGGDSLVAFESGTDTIGVSGSTFGVGAITAGVNFFTAAPGTPVGTTAPVFLFNSGTLSYDSDGDGAAAAVALVTLQSGTIAANDLLVF